MRHHGGVATATCIHGYTPDTCLICQTLQGRAAPARGDSSPQPVRTSTRHADQVSLPPATPSGAMTRAGLPSGAASAHRSWTLTKVAVAVVLAAILVFVVSGVLFAALRALELAAVALVAWWIGWRIGLWQGRRQGRTQPR